MFFCMRGSKGGRRTGDPNPTLKNHKSIGFLSNAASNPLDNHKGTKPACNGGLLSDRQLNAI